MGLQEWLRPSEAWSEPFLFEFTVGTVLFYIQYNTNFITPSLHIHVITWGAITNIYTTRRYDGFQVGTQLRNIIDSTPVQRRGVESTLNQQTPQRCVPSCLQQEQNENKSTYWTGLFLQWG